MPATTRIRPKLAIRSPIFHMGARSDHVLPPRVLVIRKTRVGSRVRNQNTGVTT